MSNSGNTEFLESIGYEDPRLISAYACSHCDRLGTLYKVIEPRTHLFIYVLVWQGPALNPYGSLFDYDDFRFRSDIKTPRCGYCSFFKTK